MFRAHQDCNLSSLLSAVVHDLPGGPLALPCSEAIAKILVRRSGKTVNRGVEGLQVLSPGRAALNLRLALSLSPLSCEMPLSQRQDATRHIFTCREVREVAPSPVKRRPSVTGKPTLILAKLSRVNDHVSGISHSQGSISWRLRSFSRRQFDVFRKLAGPNCFAVSRCAQTDYE